MADKRSTSPTDDPIPRVLAYQTPERPTTPIRRGRARGELSAMIGVMSLLAAFLLPTFRIAAPLSRDHAAIGLILLCGLVAALGVASAVGSVVLLRRATSWTVVGLLLNGLALMGLVSIVWAG